MMGDSALATTPVKQEAQEVPVSITPGFSSG